MYYFQKLGNTESFLEKAKKSLNPLCLSYFNILFFITEAFV